VTSSEWVIEVSSEDFQQQVVEQSRQRPVVVDFWAPWCGPCRALGPKLEALAVEKAGAFVLAKIDTDSNQELAQMFQVEGIPAVFGIRDGKVVDQFTGVLPPEELRAFIDRLVPSEIDKQLAQARGLEQQSPAAALEAYRAILAADSAIPAARVGLARCLLAKPGQEAEAQELLSSGDFSDHLAEVKALRTILSSRETPHGDAELQAARAAVEKDPQGAAKQLALATILAARAEYHPALDALLAAAEADRTLGRGAVRELMVKIFDIIGPRTPEADHYRSRLQLLLY
jgi:putative thioredoxin